MDYFDEWSEYLEECDAHDDPDEWDDDPDSHDPWYSCGCPTPGCIEVGGHHRSECMTAQDAAYYYAEQYGEKVPLALREPWYSLGLLHRRIRYRTETNRQEWHYHLHVELAALWDFYTQPLRRRLWPKKCCDCGKRFGDHGGCLPF